MLFVEVQPDRGNFFTFPCLFAPNETRFAPNETHYAPNEIQLAPNETRVPNETQFALNEIQFSPNVLPTHRRDAHRKFF